MRIAIFTDSYFEANGVGNTYKNLLRSAAARKLKIDLYTMGNGPPQKNSTTNVYQIPSRFPVEYYPGLTFDLAAIPRRLVRWLPETVRRNFGKKRYDIIHFAAPGSIGLYALTAARKYDLPLVGSYHTHVPFYADVRFDRLLGHPQGPLRAFPIFVREMVWLYERYFYSKTVFNFAPTNIISGAIWEHFRRPTRVMRRGVDTGKFSPDRAQKARVPTVLYLSRLAVEKNVDMLIGFRHYLPGARLVIVGDGPDRERLERLVPEAEFRGYLKGKELEEAYASAHVFIFPSITDTYGNVIQEAMASGLPVVLDSRGASCELVKDHVSGYHYLGRTDMFDHLAKLLNDPELAHRMGIQGREMMKGRTWDNVLNSMLLGYEKAIRIHSEHEPTAIRILSPKAAARSLDGKDRIKAGKMTGKRR